MMHYNDDGYSRHIMMHHHHHEFKWDLDHACSLTPVVIIVVMVVVLLVVQGIVGLPNVGKSTLFNALTGGATAQAAK